MRTLGGITTVIGVCVRPLLVVALTQLSLLGAYGADWATAHVNPTGNYLTWGNITATGDRRLMLSDGPEDINSQKLNKVLWHDGSVGETASCPTKHHRVFLWHLNTIQDTAIRVGVTIQNRSATNTIELIDCKLIKYATTDFLTAGKNIQLLAWAVR